MLIKQLRLSALINWSWAISGGNCCSESPIEIFVFTVSFYSILSIAVSAFGARYCTERTAKIT